MKDRADRRFFALSNVGEVMQKCVSSGCDGIDFYIGKSDIAILGYFWKDGNLID